MPSDHVPVHGPEPEWGESVSDWPGADSEWDESPPEPAGPAGPSRSARRAAGRTHLPAHKMRWGLLAVAVGAVLAAIVTLSISGFRSSHGLEAHEPEGGATGGRVNTAFGTANAGDCLTWTDPRTLDLSKVNCADKHLFEVTADIDLADYPGREFGPGTRFPDSLRFAELRDEHCVTAAQTYLGGRLDPRGRFVVGMINPGEPAWNSGDRTIRCGLQLVSATGNATQDSIGRVRDSDQSRIWDPGTCIGINQNLPTNEPVGCAGPHAYEVISTVDLGPQFSGGPPAATDQDKFMQEQCARVAGSYLGGADSLMNKTLTVFWDDLDVRSWLVGSHRLNCLVGKGAQDGFSSITGSAKGNILIDGQAPVPPPKSGRSTPSPLPGAATPPR